MNKSFRKCVLFLPCLLTLSFAYSQSKTQIQTPTVYAQVVYYKIETADAAEARKIIKENVLPALKQGKTEGAFIDWRYYRINLTGSDSEYNFASVFIFDSWAKTEKPLANFFEWAKKTSPGVDAGPVFSRLGLIRKVVKQELYTLTDAASTTASIPTKYIMVNFMKPVSGMADDYVKLEQETWKPIHQASINEGLRADWSLWKLTLPGGNLQPYEYVTINGFADYSKVNSILDEVITKTHPGVPKKSITEQLAKTCHQAKNELWELIENTN